MGVHRTCGEPNEIMKIKNTHPKVVTALFFRRHDVWLVPSGTTDPCGMVTNATGSAKQAHANMTGAKEIVAASHHATIAPFTMDTVVEGRNMFRIPVRVPSRSIPPPWESIRFCLAPRTYAPWGVRVVSQTESRKMSTRKTLPLFLAIRPRRLGRRCSSCAP